MDGRVTLKKGSAARRYRWVRPPPTDTRSGFLRLRRPTVRKPIAVQRLLVFLALTARRFSTESLMPSAILFDIDGTLLDSVDFHARAWQETFARYGVDVTFEEVRSQIGKGGDQLLPVFLTKEAIKGIGKNWMRIARPIFTNNICPKSVRSRASVICSNASDRTVRESSWRPRPRNPSWKSTRKLRIEGLSDADTCSDDAERSKLHPDIFVAALEKLGNPSPADVVAVGDTPYDAEAATKAGIRPVGILCGGIAEKDLRAAGCIAIYRDPADVLARYDGGLLAARSG